MTSAEPEDTSWLTADVRAAIEASEAGTGMSFETVEEMIRHLRSPTKGDALDARLRDAPDLWRRK